MISPALIGAVSAEGIPRGGGGALDPFFSNVSALLHFNGNFVDVTGKVWTPGTGATIDILTPKFGSGAGKLDATVTSNIRSPASADFTLGTGDFTIEMWIKATGSGFPAGKYFFDGVSGNAVVFQINPSGRLAYYDPSAGTGATTYSNGPSNVAMADGNWHHIAASRVSGTVRAFYDGVAWGSATSTYNMTDTSVYIGRYGVSTGFEINTEVDDFRLTKGVGRYTTNFSPPNAQFPDAGTPPLIVEDYWDNVGSLMHFEGTSGTTTFTDDTGKVWTRQGTSTSLSSTQSRFGATALFVDSVARGNTGTLNGISTPNHLDFQPGKGDFTIEWQSYFLNYTTFQTVFSYGGTSSGSLLCQTGNGDGRLNIYAGSLGTGSLMAESSSASLNAWHEYKLVRVGSTLALYRDGVIVAFSAAVANLDMRINSIFSVGADNTGQYNMAGYLDEFRFTKGVARDYQVQTAIYNSAQTIGLNSLNPKDIGTSILLTAKNKGIIPQAASSVYGMVRSRTPHNSGKYYFECSVLSAGASNFTLVGIAKAAAPVAGYPGFDANGWGYYEQTGQKYTNAAPASYGTIYTNKDVIGCAVDTSTGTVWWSKNNVWQNSGDPIAGTNPGFAGLTGPFYPAAALSNSNADILRVGIDGNDLLYDPPTGFLPWGSTVTSVLGNVQSQLHFEGANASTTFTDVKGNTWTRTGTPTISNAQHQFGSTAGLFQTGANYIKATNAQFAPGTRDFCFEGWWYFNASGAVNQMVGQSSGGLSLNRTAGGTLQFAQAFVAVRLSSSVVIGIGGWNHIACSRASGVLRLFINGVFAGAAAVADNYSATDLTVGGADGGPTTNTNGYVDEFRYTVGEPRYINDFMPQRKPFADT